MPPPATLATTQDANGHYTSVRGHKIPHSEDDSYRSFVTNSDDCIVFKHTQDGKNYYIYAEKKPGKMVLMAYFGDLIDKENNSLPAMAEPYKPKVINLDTNHKALSKNYPPPVPMEYAVTRKMTFQELAEELNYTGYASQIAEANNKYEDSVIQQGERVIIPPLYFEIPETAWNGKMPSVDSIIGNLYPTLPSPRIWVEPKQKKERENWFETFLEVAAFAAIMAFVPGAIFASQGFLQAFVSCALAGATGSTVDQVIAAGFGSQDGFNIKNVFSTALTSGISGGVLQANGMSAKGTSVLQNYSMSSLQQNILVAEEVTLAQHAVLLATGLERKFDWRTLGVSAFNAAAGYKISEMVSSKDSPVLNAGINAGIDGVGDSLILKQQIDSTQLSATVTGTMVGNYAGHTLSEAYKTRNAAERKMEQPPSIRPRWPRRKQRCMGTNNKLMQINREQQKLRDGTPKEPQPRHGMNCKSSLPPQIEI